MDSALILLLLLTGQTFFRLQGGVQIVAQDIVRQCAPGVFVQQNNFVTLHKVVSILLVKMPGFERVQNHGFQQETGIFLVRFFLLRLTEQEGIDGSQLFPIAAGGEPQAVLRRDHAEVVVVGVVVARFFVAIQHFGLQAPGKLVGMVQHPDKLVVLFRLRVSFSAVVLADCAA